MIYVVSVLDLINILKLSIILNTMIIYLVDKIKNKIFKYIFHYLKMWIINNIYLGMYFILFAY